MRTIIETLNSLSGYLIKEAPISAYHVSHNLFDKFKAEYMLSGIKQNVFGYGYYFVKSKKIANDFYVNRINLEFSGPSIIYTAILFPDKTPNLLNWFGRITPEQKMKILKQIQKEYPSIQITDQTIKIKDKIKEIDFYSTGQYMYNSLLWEIILKYQFGNDESNISQKVAKLLSNAGIDGTVCTKHQIYCVFDVNQIKIINRKEVVKNDSVDL